MYKADRALVDLARFFVLFPFAMLMLMGIGASAVCFGLFIYGLLNYPVLEALPMGGVSLFPMAWTVGTFLWARSTVRQAIKG